jgi:hypothetical protein
MAVPGKNLTRNGEFVLTEKTLAVYLCHSFLELVDAHVAYFSASP